MRAMADPADTEQAARAALCAHAAQPAEAVLRALGSGPQGLSEREASDRVRVHGPNAVGRTHAPPWWRVLAGRIANPLNVLLLALSAVSFATANPQSGALILAMVVLSIGLGTWQERRSGRAAAALRAMVHTRASVWRDGQLQERPIEALVPGDVLHLSAGDLVPADARLLSARDCFVNEAALTGEALPVEKNRAPQTDEAEALSLHNTVFMGTHVASGTATAVVVHTGSRAVFGGLAEAVAGERVQTAFDQGLDRFTRLMLRFMAVMVPLVLVLNGVGKGDWVEALLFATAVAVGLTPEMLPMLVTVNLSRGALAMSRRQVIVKRLPAIQDLGAMDVLCTDKTGTLTQDRILLEKYVDLEGQASPRVLELAYLNSHYQTGLKNLMDVAVLQYAEVHARVHAEGLYEKVDELPFDFERRRMSVVVSRGDECLLICKGAVDEVFSACSHGEAGGQRFALDAEHGVRIRAATAALNADGFRVIAIASRSLSSEERARPLSVVDERDLVLQGYIAFLDPPKDSARPALAALAAHGVAVKVLTGDNDLVTRKVCREVGLDVQHVMLGPEVAALNDLQLRERVETVQVFARLTPGQKARVIAALRARGHVVGYLGDGINDGPALKAADVGLSVDSAVDIAKESADIILLEKSLLVLDDGVVEGRRVFANLLKYIRMGASSNFGNALSVLGASAWLPFLPMAPVQVLTNNLLYDLSQSAIPTDRVDDDELATPRRWETGHLARYMLTMGALSSLFDYATFAVLYWGLHAQTVAQATLFQTGWFIESLLSQTLVIHLIRTRQIPFVTSRASPALTATTLGVCLIGMVLPWSPLAPALGMAPMPAAWWPMLAAVLMAYLVATHVASRWARRWAGL